MGFHKAVKTQAKARVALVGPSGAGKTYTALTLATVLAEGGPIAVVDTERGSASKYADLFSFDVLELDSFHPSQYVQAIKDAVAGGYKVIVLDSLTHAWNGRGGILELVHKGGNSPIAWANVKPIENAFIEAMVGATIAKIHVIATIRAKQTVEVAKDAAGKVLGVTKIGLQGQQRDDIEYEFDVVGRIDIDSTMTIDKSRCPRLKGQVIPQPGREFGEVLLTWLNAGAPDPEPDPTPTPTAPIRPAAPTSRPPAHPAPAKPATPPAASALTGNAPASLQEFLAAALEIGYAPRQVMEQLGIRSLSGIDWAAALNTLKRANAARGSEPIAMPDEDTDASGEGYYPTPTLEADAHGPAIVLEVVDTSTDEPAPAPSPEPPAEPKPIPLDWAKLRQMTAAAPLRHKSEYEFRRWAAAILGRELANVKALTMLSAEDYATLERAAVKLAEAHAAAVADSDLHALDTRSRAS